MRKRILLVAIGGLSVAGGAAFPWGCRPGAGERVTHPDLVVLPDPVQPGEVRAPSLEVLRLRILRVRRGRSAEGRAWTIVGARVEGPSGPLPVPPPVAFGAGTVSRLVLGSGATKPHYGLGIGALTGEFEVHCGPAEGEGVLREAVVEIPVRTDAAWDTTRLTLEKGATVEEDLGSFRVRFGPSPIDPDRQVDVTTILDLPGSLDAELEARDREGPLRGGLGMFARQAGTVLEDCLWGDSRRERRIAFPVAIAIHRLLPPARAGDAAEETLRFVIRDLSLD